MDGRRRFSSLAGRSVRTRTCSWAPAEQSGLLRPRDCAPQSATLNTVYQFAAQCGTSSCTGCHHGDMDLEAVRALPVADRLTFLRGRILEGALSMEAVARYLHVRLGGGSNLEEAIDTPLQFQTLITECSDRASRCAILNARVRPLAVEALRDAGRLYERRNRFVHDVLRQDLLSEEQWELSRISRPKHDAGSPLPGPEPVSAEEMITLVFGLTRVTWRLRGVLWSLIGRSREVSPYLTHQFEPQWDGSFLARSHRS